MTIIVPTDIAFPDLAMVDGETRWLVSGISWDQYEQIQAKQVDSSQFRITYLSGHLELMSPSCRHEVTKKNLARLLEAYLDEAAIDYWGLGST